MKKIKCLFFNALLSLTVVLLAVSCSGGGGDAAGYVPSDVDALVKVNLQSVIDKSGVQDNEKVKTMLRKAGVGDMSDKQYDLMCKLIDNPGESGLLLKKDIFVYFESLENETGGMVFPLSDREKFEKVLITSEVIKGEFNELEGYRYEYFDGGFVAINDEVAVMHMGGNERGFEEDLHSYVKLEKGTSLAENDIYKNINKRKNDIAAFISMRLAEQSNEFKEFIPEDIDLSDLYLCFDVVFDNGKLDFLISYYAESKEMKEYLVRNKDFIEKVSGSHFKYFSENPLGFIVASMNGKKIYEELAKNPEFKELAEKSGFDIEKMISSIDGEITFGVNSFNVMPEFLLCADVKNDEILKVLNSELRGNEISEGCYSASVVMFSVYYGIVDDVFYLTLSPAMSKGPVKEKNSLGDSDYASGAKGKYGYVFFDLNQIFSLPIMGDLRNELGEKGYEAIKKLSYVESYSENAEEARLVLHTNSEENILKTLLDLVE